MIFEFVLITILVLQDNVESTANDMWDSMEPLLFASIGTEINLSTLDLNLLLWAAVLLSITSMVSDWKRLFKHYNLVAFHQLSLHSDLCFFSDVKLPVLISITNILKCRVSKPFLFYCRHTL